jgi:hypothetical protein
VHRQSEEETGAHGRESDNHEVPLSRRFGELMSVMQADDPDTIARRPFPCAYGIQASMRCAEIQKKGDFGRGDVALLKRPAKVARTREVSVDIGAKAEIGPSLHCLPLAQFGLVFAGFHEEGSPLIVTIPQESRQTFRASFSNDSLSRDVQLAIDISARLAQILDPFSEKKIGVLLCS